MGVGEKSENFTVSKIRPGLKREFEFAVKSQSELSGSMSRLRVRKRVDEADSVGVKRQEFVTEISSDEDEKNRKGKSRIDVVDLPSGDEDESGMKRNRSPEKPSQGGVPSTLRELLETGLLEGVKVWYIRGKFKECDKGLAGVIKGIGIICSCGECKGIKTVSPAQFEVHAGSGRKRPADYLHLENQKTIRDVLNACKDASLDCFAAEIRNAISSPPEHESAFCRSCREPISDTSMTRMPLLCSSCSEVNVSHKKPKHPADDKEPAERSVQPVSPQRTGNTAPKIKSSSTKTQGKITRKDLRLHKLVFQEGVLPDGTELGYYVQGKKLLSGYKKGAGIFCECCKAVVSPSTFEAHAGYASRRKPYLQIYTSNGMSLHELSVKLAKESGISTDENDDLCSICQGAGELLCCDSCPRVFHLQCLSLTSIPNDKWYCKLCDENFQVERFAEQNPNAIAAGRIPGVDAMEQITNRCIRIVKIIDTQDGGCALCRTQDFSLGFGPRTVIICDQCEREYHVGCLREHNMQDLEELPLGDWLCSSDCERVSTALKKLLEQGDQKLPNGLVYAVKKKLAEEESIPHDFDVTWRVVHGRKSSFDEIHPLLSKAMSIFHEQFDPIMYGAREQDLIPHMVYGRNVKEIEFGGMYCAVLSINSTTVSTAVFRVFGNEVAEIPIVATSKDSEGKGYFQCLYSCLERFLKDLGVKNLLLPAAEETSSLWINRFGFNVIPQQEIEELTKMYPLMIFDGTSMLRKLVADSPAALREARGRVKND